MSIQYQVQIAPMQGDSSSPQQLIAAIPKRILRTQNMDSIKRYVAEQHNLPQERIASLEPFYRF